jgi:hypothetical protein
MSWNEQILGVLAGQSRGILEYNQAQTSAEVNVPAPRGITMTGSRYKETTLGDHSKEAHDRAQAIAESEGQRRARIAAAHEAEGDAGRANTARLESVRLKEAGERNGEESGRSAHKAIPVDKLNASNDN